MIKNIITIIWCKMREKQKWVNFNINHIIKIKITEHGYECIKKEQEKFELLIGEKLKKNWLLYDHKKDKNGWSEWQLWDLMHTFGNYIYLGCKAPFETNIQINLLKIND